MSVNSLVETNVEWTPHENKMLVDKTRRDEEIKREEMRNIQCRQQAVRDGMDKGTSQEE